MGIWSTIDKHPALKTTDIALTRFYTKILHRATLVVSMCVPHAKQCVHVCSIKVVCVYFGIRDGVMSGPISAGKSVSEQW